MHALHQDAIDRVEDRELEARRPHVEDQDGRAHYSYPTAADRWAWAQRSATAQHSMRACRLSTRLVSTIGTRAPRMMPAASAFARKLSSLASISASRSSACRNFPDGLHLHVSRRSQTRA